MTRDTTIIRTGAQFVEERRWGSAISDAEMNFVRIGTDFGGAGVWEEFEVQMDVTYIYDVSVY